MPHLKQGQTRTGDTSKNVTQQSAQTPPMQRRAQTFASHIAQLQKTIGNRGTMSLLQARSAPPIQAKVKIGDMIEKEQVMTYVKDTTPRHNELLQTTFADTLKKMPPQVREELIMRLGQNISLDDFYKGLEEWYDEESQDYTYTADEQGLRKLIKHVIKYHSFKNGWKTVGTAAYMTGDATGLSIAAAIDPRMTLKVLKGKQTATEAGPTIYKENQLPPMFDDPKAKGRVREVDVDKMVQDGKRYSKTDKNVTTMEPYQGTLDAYRVKYNQHYKYSTLKPKPWNFETYMATDIIGKQYGAHKKEIGDLLQPSATENENREQIKEYKNRLPLADKKCILLWQRQSGKKGGAHRELDSSAIMLKQMGEKIGKSFPDRVIVLIGDKTITEEELREVGVQNQIESLHEYWATQEAREKQLFNTREKQNYFLKLLSDEHDAVSVGMRSGSLESSALLGIKTIFLDDLGNNAEERMEFWAGSAAYERKNHLGDDLHFENHEDQYEGPIPNYKRVATGNQLGNVSEDLYKMCDKLLKGLDGLKNEQIDGERHDTTKSMQNAKQAIAQYLKKRNKYTTQEEYDNDVNIPILQQAIAPLVQALESLDSKYNTKQVTELRAYLDTTKKACELSPDELTAITKLIQYLIARAN